MKEAQERKAGFNEEQRATYEAISEFVHSAYLNSGVDVPEMEEVLDVLHDEWLEESSEVLEQEEIDDIFERMTRSIDKSEEG